MTAPLADVIVVTLEQAVSAPFATRQLADLGARILKIERPGEGDFARAYDTTVGGSSAFFVWGNRGKDSIELDLKDEADRDRFERLVAGADVFIQNLSPAAASRAGVAAAQMVERHPGLIACDISGYGLDGPRTDDKAYDLAIQAEAGAMALTGGADQVSKVGFSVADIAAGMYALTSILAALRRRDRTGEGAVVEISMLEALAEWTAPPVYAAASTGVVPTRAGHRHALIAPYGVYPLREGRQVLIAVQNAREWQLFADEVLRRPELADDPRFADNEARIANVEALEVEIAAAFTAVPADEIMARLTSARIANGSVNDPLQLWEHEQLRARDRFMTVTTPTGTAEVFRPPFNVSDCPDPRAAVPVLGDHDSGLIDELLRRAAEAD
ncbi:MAG: CaiB/BaiF CoA-transferase family protein [Acidimicrobiales bacterium]